MAAGTGFGRIGIGRRGLEGDTTAVGFEGKDWREASEEMREAVESKVGKLVGRRVSFSCFSSSSSLSIAVRPEAAAREV